MRTLFSCTAEYTHWDCSLCYLLTLHQVESKLTIPKDSDARGKLQFCKVLVTCNSSQKTFIPVILKIHLGEKTLLNTPSFLGKVVFQFIKCKYWYYTVIIFTAKENLCHSHVIHLVESNIVKKTWSNLGDVTM